MKGAQRKRIDLVEIYFYTYKFVGSENKASAVQH